MRSEIGQMTLDETLSNRLHLNTAICNQMNNASNDWGIKCLRYEIRDVHPPESIVSSMHQQVSAERKKRAEILESEGKRMSAVNVAKGNRESVILESEAARMRIVNCAEGRFRAEGECFV